MSTTATPAPPAAKQRGYVAALVAAFLGWMFDGFEMGLFPLIGKPALQDMLPAADDAVRGQWFTVIIAIFLVGAATGGVLFGWLGDKLGRVKAMALAIFTFAIFTGLCAFATEAWQFAGLRFVASLGMGGEWALGVALVNEIWGGKNRAWVAGMIGAASNVGFLLTGVLSLYLNASLESITHWISSIGISQETADYLMHNRGWRFLAVSGAAPALINFFILIFVPESHKWEAEKKSGSTSHWATKDLLGVLVAAIAALGIITVWTPQVLKDVGNVVAVPVTIVGLGIALWGYLLPVRRYMTRAQAGGSVQTSDRAFIMKNLIIGASLAAVALMGTWGSAQQAAKWASFLSADGTKSNIIEYVVIATALGAILITLITPLVADKLGRRITYFLLCVLAMGSSFVFFKTNHSYTGADMPVWLMITAFLIGGLTASFYGFFPLYFPELFPTSVRATGQGFCFNFGRLIAAIGSLQFVNLMSMFGSAKVTELEGEARRLMQLQVEANAFTVLSCIYIVGMVLVWFAPETKGKALS
ncbi:MFS transporter [Brevifollis gellanilyticus]|uniref:MFS transporter n=1 Tax=Brevifollis gellanilyticus TaxID=748831 RepID=A0A512M618_9BACT|nr:MFS transporter [Brevifollis gellanilyticus]GEP42178.1 MFS transporter [Brevifollis gellanilyticus]